MTEEGDKNISETHTKKNTQWLYLLLFLLLFLFSNDLSQDMLFLYELSGRRLCCFVCSTVLDTRQYSVTMYLMMHLVIFISDKRGSNFEPMFKLILSDIY